MRILLGTKKGLIVLERGARGFRVERATHPGVPVRLAVHDARHGTTWVCLQHGHWGPKLERSKDGGVSWEEVPAPKYPEGTFTKPNVPAKLGSFWSFAPGRPQEPGRLYVGTEPGGVFRSDDGGATWTLLRGLWDHPSRPDKWFGGPQSADHPAVHSIVVDPRDADRLVVGISIAGVFETTDGGVTFHPRNKGSKATFLPDPTPETGHDPHLVVACPADPDVVWQQNHCGIFRSTDGARTWTEVSQPAGSAVHFGFPIGVDPRDPLRAYVVPTTSDEQRVAFGAALSIARTDDGGKTWTVLREGLPQEHAYDVVYRHALDVSDDVVAFGSTTGNVYVSEDRGETWRCAGNNLPPVYSVRFG